MRELCAMAIQGASAGGGQQKMIDTTSITHVAVPGLFVLVGWTGEAVIKAILEFRLKNQLRRHRDGKHPAGNATRVDRRKGTDRRVQPDRRAADGRAYDRRVSERRRFTRRQIDRVHAFA